MYDVVVYKIFCKDDTIQDTYIGHTKNFETRKTNHMKDSLTSSNKLYDFIRNHGGWYNWDMVILGSYRCRNKGEASRVEWFWWNKLDGSLNTVRSGIYYIQRDMKRLNLVTTSYINVIESSLRIISS